ncbi:hypothetical protein TNCV_3270811 [Trichonephila clavipes]|nr:hypothetical protein TNCV_3270811 [Trichonephila clavipes]
MATPWRAATSLTQSSRAGALRLKLKLETLWTLEQELERSREERERERERCASRAETSTNFNPLTCEEVKSVESKFSSLDTSVRASNKGARKKKDSPLRCSMKHTFHGRTAYGPRAGRYGMQPKATVFAHRRIELKQELKLFGH